MGTCVAMRVRVEGLEPKRGIETDEGGSVRSALFLICHAARRGLVLVDRGGDENERKNSEAIQQALDEAPERKFVRH